MLTSIQDGFRIVFDGETLDYIVLGDFNSQGQYLYSLYLLYDCGYRRYIDGGYDKPDYLLSIAMKLAKEPQEWQARVSKALRAQVEAVELMKEAYTIHRGQGNKQAWDAFTDLENAPSLSRTALALRKIGA